jgi:hypothetical protein
MLLVLDFDGGVSLRASRNFAFFRKAEVREAESFLFFHSHGRRDNLHSHRLCLPGVLITPVQGIGKDPGRSKIPFHGGFKGRNKSMGITLTSTLHFHMSDQVEGLISFFPILVRAVCLHHLHLIPLALVSIIGGIRI